MDITYVTDDDRRIQYAKKVEEPDHFGIAMTESDVQTIAETFNTPLRGSYNWDYTEQDNRIKKLYELGKKLNWNATLNIDWDRTLDWHEIKKTHAIEQHPLKDYAPYKALSEKDKALYQSHIQSWICSQFLHGEQGALLVASQLVSCAPTYNAKLYAASQTFDEARHVETFNHYLQRKIGFIYPVSASLKSILDKILSDPRWDLKFIGMQIIIEGLALGAFNTIKLTTTDPVLKQIMTMIIRDEARHVTFGVNYLEEFVKTLSPEEVEERAQFAYEACVISRERLMQVEVWQHWGFDVEEAKKIVLQDGLLVDFQRNLFSRIIPNLKRIGLLTESVKPKFEEMGVLDFVELPDDGDIDWAELSKPMVA